MDFLRSDRNALWLVPLVLGIGSCVCSFAPMLYLWGTVVIPIDAQHMPLGDTFAFAGKLSENLTPWQAVYTVLLYCVPLSLMVAVAALGFFLIRGYQSQGLASKKPSKPPIK